MKLEVIFLAAMVNTEKEKKGKKLRNASILEVGECRQARNRIRVEENKYESQGKQS